MCLLCAGSGGAGRQMATMDFASNLALCVFDDSNNKN